MKNIMFQGTGSNVGKSILVSGFLRILSNMNMQVAPFKSQNMALNSFITMDLKEMGRAQVVQAEAAKIIPDVRMNPILLKPTKELGSQVILLGEKYRNMKAVEYYKEKNNFKKIVLDAYNYLKNKYDYIVIEGAGSPAEINLRENDIVNMGLANLVDSPVILVADIDRGGVFASIYGTYKLLDYEDRKRLKGFIINKFRGDKSLLMPGIKEIENKLNTKCYGVMPYVDILLDDEDSLSDKLNLNTKSHVNIGIIKLPYISNFTDFNAFEYDKNIGITYIDNPNDINNMDILIIPGTKNTLKDLEYLKDNYFSEKIIEFSKTNKIIIGICGGYQMLGKVVFDPLNEESSINKIDGLNLLPISTTILKNKVTTQSKGIIKDIPFLKNEEVKGYEIHMGETEYLEEVKPFIHMDLKKDGAIKNNIIGTYFHAIFDNDNFRNSLINYVLNKKGIKNISSINYNKLKQNEFDNLAKVMKENLDIESIIELMEK